MRAFLTGCLVMLSGALLGCESTTAATEFPQIPSHAIAQTEKTSLGSALKEKAAGHPRGQSGLRVLMSGSESFAMRLALIRAAEKTLDLQYYSIHDDTTANLLLEAIVRAAKRGVRIRFILDNISFAEVGETFSVLDGLKNVEIRIFNPFATRDEGIMARSVRTLTDLGSMNQRMHNKALIGDNQMAIIGGRNLGDEYFEENTDVAFRDIDILTAGPVTAGISRSFDQYWNSKDAVPVGQLRKPSTDPQILEQIRSELARHWEEVRQTEKGRKLLESALPQQLKDGEVSLIWAKAELVADAPHKIGTDREDATSRPLMRLDSLLDRAKSEFIAVTPYFVPREEGVEWLAGLVQRGVRVRVLTNSLASTDVVAVHTGYRRYREELVKRGIELYEMMPTGGKRPPQRLIGRKAPASASLHAKVYVVDRREVMIGSFNLDPRSVELNTELALVIHSTDIAAQVIKMFNEVTAPETSYHVTITEDSAERLVWEGKDKKGDDVQYFHDPKAGFWRSIQADLMGLLPIEDQL